MTNRTNEKFWSTHLFINDYLEQNKSEALDWKEIIEKYFQSEYKTSLSWSAKEAQATATVIQIAQIFFSKYTIVDV